MNWKLKEDERNEQAIINNPGDTENALNLYSTSLTQSASGGI